MTNVPLSGRRLSDTFKTFVSSERSAGLLLLIINSSKLAILSASVTAGLVGFLWLKAFGKPVPGDHDMDTMDFVPGRA